MFVNDFNSAHYFIKPSRRTYLMLRYPWRTSNPRLILEQKTRSRVRYQWKTDRARKSPTTIVQTRSDRIGLSQKGAPSPLTGSRLSLHSGDCQTWNCDWRAHLVTCIHLSTWMLSEKLDEWEKTNEHLEKISRFGEMSSLIYNHR